MAKPSGGPRRSILSSGALTAISFALITGVSAAVGVVIAREFGRGAETDGFFAAYAVFLVLVLAASAIRVAVLPALARGREDGVFGAVLGGYAVAVGVVSLLALGVGVGANDWAAGVLTGDLPEPARAAAADALVFLVPAAAAQLFAALAASGLAAYDSYGTAAAGYALGSVLGLALILWRVGEDGIVACAWGILLNAAVALAVPALALARRREDFVFRTRRLAVGARLGELARAAALPLVLQALFVVCLRFASGLGTGSVTSFSYAYMIASGLVAVTASSLGMVSSVPLTRSALSPERASRHVVSTSLVSFAAVAAGAGVFALVGDRIVEAALGPAYASDAGGEIGRLVGFLGPWMAASVGVTLTFPLLFVAGRSRLLPLLAVAVLAAHVPVAWAGLAWLELEGLALALALTTLLVLVGLLSLLDRVVLATAVTRLGLGAALVAALAFAAFGLADALLPAVAASAVGLAGFGALLLAARGLGLADAWGYLRTLH